MSLSDLPSYIAECAGADADKVSSLVAAASCRSELRRSLSCLVPGEAVIQICLLKFGPKPKPVLRVLPVPALPAPAHEDPFQRTDLVVPVRAAPAWYSIGQLPPHLRMTPELFETLYQLHPESLGKIKMFGKIIDTPRYQQNFGEEYFYTGLLHPANPIPHPYLSSLMEWVCSESGKAYKQMIVNWYRNGKDYIGDHSDSVKDMVPNSAIYSISFGASRDFVISSKSGVYKETLRLRENGVVIMGGSMQHHYKHGVPKEAGAGRRINVTFRLMSPK